MRLKCSLSLENYIEEHLTFIVSFKKFFPISLISTMQLSIFFSLSGEAEKRKKLKRDKKFPFVALCIRIIIALHMEKTRQSRGKKYNP
jgi:hypothetical protein